MKSIFRNKLVASFLIILFVSTTVFADSWSKIHENEGLVDQNGNYIPSKGIPLMRVYSGVIQVGMNSDDNDQFAVTTELFSHYRGSTSPAKGQFVCVFLSKATCEDCKGSGRYQENGRSKTCIQCDGKGEGWPYGSAFKSHILSEGSVFVQTEASVSATINIPYEADYVLLVTYRFAKKHDASGYIEEGLQAKAGKHGVGKLHEIWLKRNR